jgi:hypothetical protein
MKATILFNYFHARQFFIACISLFFYFSPFQAMSVTDPTIEPSSWTKLVFPTAYLDNLSKEDADEQRRDWLLMAVIAREMPDSNAVNLQNALYDLTPLRHDYIQAYANLRFGEARSLPMRGNQLLLLVPYESINRRRVIQEHIDQYRMTMGSAPDSVRLYEYRLEKTDDIPDFRQVKIETGKVFFTPEWGYFEQIIGNEAELKDFLRRIHDLTFCQQLSTKQVMLGGRLYDQPIANISTENIATIYEASKNAPMISFSLNPTIEEKDLARQLQDIADGKEAAYANILNNPAMPVSDRAILLVALQKRTTIFAAIANDLREKNFDSWETYVSYLTGDFPRYLFDSTDNRQHIPQDVKQMLDEIREIDMSKDPNLAKNPPCYNSLKEQVLAFRAQNGFADFAAITDTIWKALLEKAPKTARELSLVAQFMSDLEKGMTTQEPVFTPQSLAGTEVGMIMFYTDFSLKRRQNQEGFVKKAVGRELPYSTSPVHLAYSNQYPSSRMWLSPKDAGFDLHGETLLFSALTTQLNAKSKRNNFSTNRKVETEVMANYSVAQYMAWWTRHFETIADHEQQYHRLDQLMKWSILFRWAEKKGGTQAFDFLDSVKIRRDFRFVNWYATTPDLRLREYLPKLPTSPCRSKDSVEVCFNFKASGASGGILLDGFAAVAKKVPNKAIKLNPTMRAENDVRYSSLIKRVQFDQKMFDIIEGSKQVVSSNLSGDVLRGSNTVLGQTQQTTRELLPRAADGFGQQVSYGKKAVFSISIEQLANKPTMILKVTGDRITPIETLTEALASSFDPVRKAADLQNVKRIIRLDNEGMLAKIGDDADYVIATNKPQLLRVFAPKESKMTMDKGSDLSFLGLYPRSIGHTEVIASRLSTVQQLQKMPYRLLTRYGTVERKNVLEFLKEKPIKTTTGKLIPTEEFLIQSKTRALNLKGNEVDGYRFAPKANTTTAKKIVETDLNMLHEARFDIFSVLRRSPKKARGYFFNEEKQLLSISKGKPWKKKWATLAQGIIEPDGVVRGIVLNKKAKGVRLLDGNLLEMSPRAVKSTVDIAKEVNLQLKKNDELANHYRQFDHIEALDVQTMAAIHPTNVQLYDSYVAIRNLSEANFTEGQAVVSLRTSNETPQYLVRKAGGNVELHPVTAVEKPDFGNLNRRVEACTNLKELLQATEGEAKLMKQISDYTKAKQIVTLEADDNILTMDKIAALHETLPPSVRIVRDNPNIAQSLRLASNDPLVQLTETIVLTTSKALPDGLSRDMEDSLSAFKVTIENGINYTDFLSALKKAKYKQVILIADDNSTDNSLVFADRSVAIEELTNEVRRVSTTKDYLYILAPAARRWQEALAKAGKFGRVIAQELTDTQGFAQQNLRQFFSQLLNFGDGTQPNKLDDMLQIITRGEVESQMERLRQTPVKKQNFPLFMEKLKATPTFKADKPQNRKNRF